MSVIINNNGPEQKEEKLEPKPPALDETGPRWMGRRNAERRTSNKNPNKSRNEEIIIIVGYCGGEQKRSLLFFFVRPYFAVSGRCGASTKILLKNTISTGTGSEAELI